MAGNQTGMQDQSNNMNSYGNMQGMRQNQMYPHNLNIYRGNTMNHLTSNRNMQIAQNPTPYLDSQNMENQIDTNLNKQVLLIIINQ